MYTPTTDALHPNLARLAKKYDMIVADWAAARIDSATAKAQLRRLQARDDQGVVWTINPDDGKWYRVTMDGRLVEAVPPRSGVASLSPFDVSIPNGHYNPDNEIMRVSVDAPSYLSGRVTAPPRVASDEPKRSPRMLLAGVCVALAIVFGMLAVSADDGQTTYSEPAPQAQVIVAP